MSVVPLFEDPKVKPFEDLYPRLAKDGWELLFKRSKAHRTVCVTCGYGVFEIEYKDYRPVRFKSYPGQTFFVCRGCHMELIPVDKPVIPDPYR